MKNDEVLKQTSKLTANTGSLINHIYSNNSSIPKVGEYCTFMLYTDRHVGIVREVSKDFKKVTIEGCNTVADKTKQLGEGHNDNTTFTFDKENKIDDCTLFMFNSDIGNRWGIPHFLIAVGFKGYSV